MRRLAALALIALLAACDGKPIVDAPDVRPAMWVVEDADTRLVLLGSVHQLPPGLDWMRGRVAQEAGRADEAILELAPSELEAAPALFAAASADEAVPPLFRRFDTSTARRAADHATAAGIDGEDADALESWALALVIGQQLSADAGLVPGNGVEARIGSTFAADGRPVQGLETAGQQLAMFDALPAAAQDAMVRSIVADAATAPQRTRRLVAAWARGDVPGLTTAAQEAMADTPALIEPVIHARNRAWAAALERRMARPGRVLVVVGAGHLVGPRSLISELERRGVAVRRLQ